MYRCIALCLMFIASCGKDSSDDSSGTKSFGSPKCLLKIDKALVYGGSQSFDGVEVSKLEVLMRGDAAKAYVLMNASMSVDVNGDSKVNVGDVIVMYPGEKTSTSAYAESTTYTYTLTAESKALWAGKCRDGETISYNGVWP